MPSVFARARVKVSHAEPPNRWGEEDKRMGVGLVLGHFGSVLAVLCVVKELRRRLQQMVSSRPAYDM